MDHLTVLADLCATFTRLNSLDCYNYSWCHRFKTIVSNVEFEVEWYSNRHMRRHEISIVTGDVWVIVTARESDYTIAQASRERVIAFVDDSKYVSHKTLWFTNFELKKGNMDDTVMMLFLKRDNWYDRDEHE